MNSISELMTEWFSERPKWLQIAANRLLQQSELSDKDVSELVILCKQEVQGELSETTCSFPATAFARDTSESLRLCSIGEVKGINALAPKKPLEFGKGKIVVVYGNNGSGKSGYIRLLKHVCGARNMGTLLRNVYESDSGSQEACISFIQNDTPRNYTWTGQGVCNELSGVDIFDTSFGDVFISNGDEVSYEPPELSLFSSLISLCEKVALELENESSKHQSKKPNISAEKKETAEAKWYESISFETTTEEIDEYCLFNHTHKNEILNLQQRLVEQLPEERAKRLRKQKYYIETLVRDTQKYLQQLSNESFRQIVALKKNLRLKKQAADMVAKKAFSGSQLEGVGSDIWKELWKAARKYSKECAYKDNDYPNVTDDSLCVLCHQSLSEEAKKRLISFEDFVKGETQQALTTATQEYDTAIQDIGELPTTETLKARIDATGISDEGFTTDVTKFFEQLNTRKSLLLEIESEDDIPKPLLQPKWISEANSLSRELGERAEKFEEDAKTDKREEIKENLDSLQTRKWLCEHRTAINEEVARLKLLNQIQEAKKLTNTRALSQKKGELAELLITAEFVQRFKNELNLLGASQIRVELVKTNVSKGKVFHKIKLRNTAHDNISDVLSEGERRIVSIAAFLADVTGKRNKSPFIFDDPISSLDQNYEEAVVQRLIELSEDRQIIVFTHRLSLLALIRHFADKKSIKYGVVGICSTEWGTGEPAPIPISQNDIKTALNHLINKRYQDAKEFWANGNFEQTEILLKAICSDFRVLVERAIENDLLCGVVQRFQRPIHTLKIKKLAKLKQDDCSFLDELMTKYSRFEHSHPSESPVNLPNLEDLLNDMTSLKTWREKYEKRELPSEMK